MYILKSDSPYLTKSQWKQVLLAMSGLILLTYIVAMIFSLCGSNYFILIYQNTQMDNIESFCTKYNFMPAINCLFLTLEFSIIMSFILNKRVNLIYVLVFYSLRVGLSIPFAFPPFLDMLYPFVFYVAIIIIDQLITNKKLSAKLTGLRAIKLLISIGLTLILQYMILVIKTGRFDGTNHIMNLSAAFIYAIEYDIALLVLLVTIAMLLNKEKGDSLCTTYHNLGGSSQTSMMQSQKSLEKKELTKTQKNKLRLLYARMYVLQITTFALVLVLPFLLGKVFEFLLMYLSFAITRFILGFKYSLHFKKETLCIGASLIVFGILSLAVPFFYVTLILAIIIGVGLAIFLNLSYKYKSLWLFNRASKTDKFAVLYTFFDGDLSERHVTTICRYKGLNHFQTLLIYEFVSGDKISVIAHRRKYSERMTIYKIDEAIKQLLS